MSRSGRTDLHSRTTIRTARNSSMWSSRLCCRRRSTQPRESSSMGLRWAPDLSHPPPPALSSGPSQAVPPPLISCAPYSYHRDQGTSHKSPSIGKAIISPLSVRARRETVRFLNTADSPLFEFCSIGHGTDFCVDSPNEQAIFTSTIQECERSRAACGVPPSQATLLCRGKSPS